MIVKSLYLGLIGTGICLGAGLALGGYFVGQTLYNGKVALNIAEVKGLATRRVKSDQANWSVSFSVSSDSKADIEKIKQQAIDTQKKIIAILSENNFRESEITPNVIGFEHKEYRDKAKSLLSEKFVFTGAVDVETNQIEQLLKVRLKMNDLICANVNVMNPNPKFHFTKLNTIKPEMLREATVNARLAAMEFAKDAKVRVGKIAEAKQGAFSILDAGEMYGYQDKIYKDIRVVTNISFYLTE